MVEQEIHNKRLVYTVRSAIHTDAQLLIWNSTSYAAANASVGLNINGVLRNDGEAKMIDLTAFVPIRTIDFLPDLQVAWDNKTKTVTVTNASTKEKVSLVAGNKIASKGNDKISLSSPARIIDGVTYVPFRFIGEAFGATVKWDNASKSVAIYNIDPAVIASLNSKDLKTARTAALKLPRISFHEDYFVDLWMMGQIWYGTIDENASG